MKNSSVTRLVYRNTARRGRCPHLPGQAQLGCPPILPFPRSGSANRDNPCMSLPEQLQRDITAAMKARDAASLTTLRMVKAALKDRQNEKMAPHEQKEAPQE